MSAGGLSCSASEVTQMTATLIVPGCGGSGSRHWQSWLEAQIPGSQRVALPDPDRPDLSARAAAVRWHIARQSNPLLIVARLPRRSPGRLRLQRADSGCDA